MGRRIFAALLGALAACAAHAQSGGYYQALAYRYDDPFVFCTEGQGWKNDPLQCWIPVAPYTGAFTLMPYCQPFTQWGKPWTNDDFASLAQYRSTCPKAVDSGQWDGAGQPDKVPFDH